MIDIATRGITGNAVEIMTQGRVWTNEEEEENRDTHDFVLSFPGQLVDKNLGFGNQTLNYTLPLTREE